MSNLWVLREMRSEEAGGMWKEDICDIGEPVEPGDPSLVSPLLQRLRQEGTWLKARLGNIARACLKIKKGQRRLETSFMVRMLAQLNVHGSGFSPLPVRPHPAPPPPQSSELLPHIQIDQYFTMSGYSVWIPITAYRSFEINFKVYRFRKDYLIGQIFLCSIPLFQQHRDFLYDMWIWKTEKEIVTFVKFLMCSGEFMASYMWYSSYFWQKSTTRQL